MDGMKRTSGFIVDESTTQPVGVEFDLPLGWVGSAAQSGSDFTATGPPASHRRPSITLHSYLLDPHGSIRDVAQEHADVSGKDARQSRVIARKHSDERALTQLLALEVDGEDGSESLHQLQTLLHLGEADGRHAIYAVSLTCPPDALSDLASDYQRLLASLRPSRRNLTAIP